MGAVLARSSCGSQRQHDPWCLVPNPMEYLRLAEGGANVLFRRPDGTLIRVSKHGTDPHKVAWLWNAVWRPRLGQFMRSDMEVVADPYFGFVVQMAEITDVIGEFKPKWLVQSPDAPDGAVSCRTCAVRQMRGKPALGWCSLDLAHGQHLEAVAAKIARAPEHVPEVQRLLAASKLVKRLCDAQRQFTVSAFPKDCSEEDKEEGRTVYTKVIKEDSTRGRGAAQPQTEACPDLYAAQEDNSQEDILPQAQAERLRLCMALRDCTVLITGGAKPGLWIVDLDPKPGSSKLSRWQYIEQQLQDWYTRRSPSCRLSRPSS